MKSSRREFLQASGTAAGAAMLAGSPADAQMIGPVVASLQQYFSQNAMRYFALPPLADEVPQVALAGPVSITSTLPPTTLQGGVSYPMSDYRIAVPSRTHWGASLVGNPLVGGFPCFRLWRSYSCKGVARQVGSPTVLRFRTDARVVEIAGVAVNGPGQTVQQTLMVDGRLVPKSALGVGTPGSGGGYVWQAVRVDFGYRGIRDVWLETTGHPAYVKVGAGDTLLPNTFDAEPQMTVIGDSYLQSRSASFHSGIAMELGARLGVRNVATDAIGGTGYQNTGGSLGNLNDRLPAHAADGSNIYVVMAGINDYGDVVSPSQLAWLTRASYEAAVIGYVRNLRAARPDALIVVTAPFCPIPPMSDSSYVANRNVNDSGSGDYLYKASVHKRAVQQIAGPWVYIDVLMGGGWLNSSGAVGDVSDLQWFTGGTPYPGTTVTYRPGNTRGGAGGGFGGIESVPVLSPGSYSQTPNVRAVGGSGTGLTLAGRLDSAGRLVGINVLLPGTGYAPGPGGLPTVVIDNAYEQSPAVAGVPVMMTPVNPNGRYPLPELTSADVAKLNNAPLMLMPDTTHPSPRGVSYLAARLAQNIAEGVMAL